MAGADGSTTPSGAGPSTKEPTNSGGSTTPVSSQPSSMVDPGALNVPSNDSSILPPHPTPRISPPSPSEGGGGDGAASPSPPSPILPPHPTPPAESTPARQISRKRGRPEGSSNVPALLQDGATNQPPLSPPPPPAATANPNDHHSKGKNVVLDDAAGCLSAPAAVKIDNKTSNQFDLNEEAGDTLSEGSVSNHPPPQPNADPGSQVLLRNRKDSSGNMRWYYSTAGAPASKKWKHYPPAPPQQRVFGPELPFTCKLCGMGFFKVRSLCGHMKAHPARNWRGAFPPPENVYDRGVEAALAIAMELAPPPVPAGGDGTGAEEKTEGEKDDVAAAAPAPPVPEVPPPAAAAAAADTRVNVVPDLNGPPPPDSDEEEMRDQ